MYTPPPNAHTHTYRLGQPPRHFQNAATRVKDSRTTKLAGFHPCHCLTEVAVPLAWSYTLAQYTWQPAHLVLALYTQQLLQVLPVVFNLRLSLSLRVQNDLLWVLKLVQLSSQRKVMEKDILLKVIERVR